MTGHCGRVQVHSAHMTRVLPDADAVPLLNVVEKSLGAYINVFQKSLFASIQLETLRGLRVHAIIVLKYLAMVAVERWA